MSDVLKNGIHQAYKMNAPKDTIDRMKLAIYEQALFAIIKNGGHAGIIAQSAINSAQRNPDE
jgi:anti-sigma regulatory factor (Ser/Thr protein kinase)